MPAILVSLITEEANNGASCNCAYIMTSGGRLYWFGMMKKIAGFLGKGRGLLGMIFILACAMPSLASVFGDVRGIVHDPQHRPVAAARIRLLSRSSEFFLTAQTNSDGEFFFRDVTIGQYFLHIESAGFSEIQQPVTVVSGSAPILHFQMAIAPVTRSVEVKVVPEQTGTDAATP